MKKRQSKLIELLDKEGLIDKELKQGCIIGNPYQDEDNTCKYRKFIRTQKRQSGGYYYTGILYNGIVSGFIIDNSDDKECEIIGQYHLGSIVQWFNKYKQFQTITGDSIVVAKINLTIYLDITKPPIERTEEQNKELVEFMEKVLDSNK